MSKNLIIVESPKKIDTYKKVLGTKYKVLASRGHCIDLPEKSLAINIKKKFEPTFEVKDDHVMEVKSIQTAAKQAEHVYFMTDEDREGEAIAWHLHNIIKEKSKAQIHRAMTNEITAKGIQKALDNPTTIDESKIEAYLTRRLLDRIAGYKTSYLTYQATGGRSAGRVQSAILRIIADREQEIIDFKPEEYWELFAYLISSKGDSFVGKLSEKIKIPNEKEATKLYDKIVKGSPVISKVEIKEVNVNPSPPFTTIPMTGAASTYFGWGAKKTMDVAQKLYEGGHITYMRTDSPFMANEAIELIRSRVEHEYGKEYLPSKPKFYTSKKGAQEAHECCRPTDVNSNPSLAGDESKLYDLIWKRAVASQMVHGVDERTKVITDIAGYDFITNGNVVKKQGFRKVWTYSNPQSVVLPKLSEGEKCTLKTLEKEQKFTSPPPRYSDASLGKTLEKLQIARPSTFASFVETLINRNYILRKNKSFRATDLGLKVTKFLKEADVCFVDIKFTAEMESLLDEIQSENKTRLEVLTEFWERLKKDIDKGKGIKKKNEETEYKCPQCKSFLLKKRSKFGEFYSCSNYKAPKMVKGEKVFPEDSCSYVAKIGENGEPVEKAAPKKKEYADFPCEKCGSKMVKRKSQYGEFFGCDGFPKCKSTADLEGVFKVAKKKKSWPKKSKKKSAK